MTLADFAQVVQSASVIMAALVAAYGFDAWRREFVFKRRMELAETVLEHFYKASDVIHAIRSPFGFGGEGKSRQPGANEQPEHKDALDQAYVLIERYNQHAELFAEIHTIRYRVKAQLGPEAAKPFEELNRIVNELIMSAREMARLSTFPAWSLRSPEAEEKHHKRLLDVHSIYYWSGGEDDPITPRVQAAVAEVERTCRGIIESKGTLFALINYRLRKNG